MSKQGDINKNNFLGMSFGTAQSKLRKMVLFSLLKKYNENICYRCGKEIETVDDLSIEHKKAWLNVSRELFWDLNNVSFSHLHCNYSEHSTKPRILIHGTPTGYRYGCRCDDCVQINREDTRNRMRKFRNGT